MDPYTKAVLTIIAATLVIIATQLAIPSARAVVGECGEQDSDPCAVYLVYKTSGMRWQPCVDRHARDHCMSQ